MPDTGLFYLYEVLCAAKPSADDSCGPLQFVRAQCIGCCAILEATSAPSLLNIPGGGAVITCMECGSRQAISGARFAEFVRRFPMGNEAAHRAGQTRAGRSQQGSSPGRSTDDGVAQ